jgi:hypothetical protein
VWSLTVVCDMVERDEQQAVTLICVRIRILLADRHGASGRGGVTCSGHFRCSLKERSFRVVAQFWGRDCEQELIDL